MELSELNGANQAPLSSNGTINVNRGPLSQQIPINHVTGHPHMYRNQQQAQQVPKYVTNPKMSKHRELPVDVPDSFVGVAKQSPRYPPPKPNRQVSPTAPVNNMSTFNRAPNIPYNPASQENNVRSAHQAMAPPIIQSTAANIVSHNNSLRSSIKLKQLEKSRGGQQHPNYPVGQLQPAVNQAFELNEDDDKPAPNISNNQISDHLTRQQRAYEISQSMPDLCSIYNRLQRRLNGDFLDVSNDAKLVKLLSIYNTILQTHGKNFKIPNLTSKHAKRLNSQANQEPITYKVSDLLQSVIYMLRDVEMTNDVINLLTILCKHETDGVCSAFDRITQSFEFAKASHSEIVDADEANLRTTSQPPQYQQTMTQDSSMYQYRDHQLDDYEYANDQMNMDPNMYQNGLHPLTDIDLSDGTFTRTVRIEKNSNQALGATIKNEDGCVVVSRVVYGGVAHRSGLLNEGDEILEVNGIEMRGKSVNEAFEILEGLNDTLTFRIISRNYKPQTRGSTEREKVLVRAFFKYDGEKDRYMPCKELGLSFERGEVLEIVDQSDPKWWQAYRESDSEFGLARLIPSINFLKEREKEDDQEDFANAYFKREKKNLVSLLFNCPKGTSPRRRKKLSIFPIGPEERLYYEEVSLFYPVKFLPRPIILIGPKMIGQREIVARLLQDTNKFASAISHTSKPRGPNERDGVDFHFVSRAQFELDIKAGKFIECGQYQNQYYGTSFDAMKEVQRSKKFCVHLVNVPSLFNFRQGRAGSQLKPFFVFVKPDDHPDKLRNLVAKFSQQKSSIEENVKAIMAEVEMIETHYLPYFDLVLTVSDVERAFQELLNEIYRIEKNPQWIPRFWQDSPPN